MREGWPGKITLALFFAILPITCQWMVKKWLWKNVEKLRNVAFSIRYMGWRHYKKNMFKLYLLSGCYVDPDLSVCNISAVRGDMLSYFDVDIIYVECICLLSVYFWLSCRLFVGKKYERNNMKWKMLLKKKFCEKLAAGWPLTDTAHHGGSWNMYLSKAKAESHIQGQQ